MIFYMLSMNIFSIIIILLISNSIIRVFSLREYSINNSISNYNNSIQRDEDRGERLQAMVSKRQ